MDLFLEAIKHEMCAWILKKSGIYRHVAKNSHDVERLFNDLATDDPEESTLTVRRETLRISPRCLQIAEDWISDLLPCEVENPRGKFPKIFNDPARRHGHFSSAFPVRSTSKLRGIYRNPGSLVLFRKSAHRVSVSREFL